MANKDDDYFNEKLEAERRKFDMERRLRKTYEAISPTSIKGSWPLNSSQHGAQIPSFDFSEDQVQDLWATFNQGAAPGDRSREIAEMKKLYLDFEELLSQQEEKLQSSVERLEGPNICPVKREQMTNELNTVLMAHEETRLNLMQIVERLLQLGEAQEREQQATKAQTQSFDFSEQHVQDLWAALNQGAAAADQGGQMVDMKQVYQEFDDLLAQQEEKLQSIVEKLENPNISPKVQQQLIDEFNTVIQAHEETRMNLMQIVESLKLGEDQGRHQQATYKNQDTRHPLAGTTPQAPSTRKKEQWKAPVSHRTPAQRAPISQRTQAQRAPISQRTQPQRVTRRTRPQRGEVTDKEMEKYFKPSLRPPPGPKKSRDMEEDNDPFGTWQPLALRPLPIVQPKYESYPVPAETSDNMGYATDQLVELWEEFRISTEESEQNQKIIEMKQVQAHCEELLADQEVKLNKLLESLTCPNLSSEETAALMDELHTLQGGHEEAKVLLKQIIKSLLKLVNAQEELKKKWEEALEKHADIKPSVGHPMHLRSLRDEYVYDIPFPNVPSEWSPIKRGFKKGKCPFPFTKEEKEDPANHPQYFQKPYLSHEERDRYNKLLDSQPLFFDFTDYQTPEQVKVLWDEINRREEEQRRLLDEITKTKKAKFWLEDDLAEEAEKLMKYEEKMQCPDLSPDERKGMARVLAIMQRDHEKNRLRLTQTQEKLTKLQMSQKKETPPQQGLRPDTTRLGDDLPPKGFVLQAAPQGRKRSNAS